MVLSNKIRLLIADDHSSLRVVMRRALAQNSDIEVVAEAADGMEAIRLSVELKPDIVLMDIKMPKTSGVEATKHIRRLSPATAVLFWTAYNEDRYVIGLLEAGAAGYILKSTRVEGLVRAVRAVYDGEAVIDLAVLKKLAKHSLLRNEETVYEYGKRSSYTLSAREVQVLRLASRGMSNKEIADKLCVTIATIKAHFYSTFNKMGVASRTEAIMKGMREGVITIGDIYDAEGV